ncbi:Hsp70 family protein [Dactylosporangium sp. AC04546]|uniref:Hsp70 family protein n=1 Tax=Dactylosporangium sp. AC04546 TaxID=2862460 RepID=UPI001EDCFEA0|nr:Hsp70 family protein [Dactylosporangium sp. AC04546]WVK80113.1 Hsp70 family protein [Dactylosporangium sp. AC04546]
MTQGFGMVTDRVLKLAREEADQLGHDQVSTAHLLLGLSRLSTGAAWTTLELMGADLTLLRAAVAGADWELRDGGVVAIIGGTVGLALGAFLGDTNTISWRAKAKVPAAVPGGEQVLLGIARNPGCDGARILVGIGLPLAAVVQQVNEVTRGKRGPAIATVTRPALPTPPAEAAPGPEAVLVVDFGTSASSAAVVIGGEVRLIKEPASGLYSWPSAVCRDGDGLVVGSAANARKRAVPTAYRTEFKRDLGQAAPVPLGDREYAPRELVAALLRQFGALAEQQAERPVRRLLLTVPASHGPGDPRAADLVAAGEAAGFAEVELLAEPVAAGLGPLTGSAFGAGDLVLVYDFGGGTFDAALIRHAGGDGHEVLGHAALDDCGGRDVDALLAAHLRDTGGEEFTAAVVPPGLTGDAALRARLHLADFVRGLKHQLSEADRVEDYPSPAAPPAVLDRVAFERLVRPLLDRTVECCEALLDRCGVGAADLTAVLLVGGTTRMPAVADRLTARLARPLRRPEDPDLAVVRGAATRAGTVRTVAADRPRPARTPLSWAVPTGGGRLVRWLVEVDGRYAAGAPLALVRAADGTLWRLTAPDRAGTVLAHHADPGGPVADGDWLVTTSE